LILLLCFFSITNRICGQASPRQNMILESTFEGPGFLSGWYNNQHCCDYSIQQSSEKVKAGSSALRIEVRSTDEVISNSIRAELVTDSDPLNQDRWYGFSMYLLDWVDDDAPESVFQWHPDNNVGTASMTLLTTGGRFTYVTSNDNSGTNATLQYTDLGPVISNQWVDFVIHIRWATDTTGLLQVWMNGSQVINRLNVKTAAGTSYFKLGINKFGWLTQASTVTKRIFYFDEVRIGNANATYKDVVPFLPRRDYFQGLR
ncbi:MAG: polysaccharide lyase, partial [Bacteroidota bacterium]|nr:polysaccharide lyase [Bacteroidota bacterium]